MIEEGVFVSCSAENRLTLTAQVLSHLCEDGDGDEGADHLVDAEADEQLVGALAQLVLQEKHREHEPHGGQLADDDERQQLHERHALGQPLEEERRVEDGALVYVIRCQT